MQLFKNRPEMCLIGKLISPVRKQHGNIAKPQPIEVRFGALIVVTDQTPDLVLNDLSLAPNSGKGESPNFRRGPVR